MTTRSLALALSAATLGACHSEAPHATADLVLTGGDLRTMEPTLAGSTALAVRDGRIVYVGSDAEASKWIGPASKVLEISGNTVLPGLIDSHIHAAEGALARGGCSLADEQLTIEEAAPRIRACVEKDKGTGWLTVTDVNAAGFKASRRELDSIVRCSSGARTDIRAGRTPARSNSRRSRARQRTPKMGTSNATPVVKPPAFWSKAPSASC